MKRIYQLVLTVIFSLCLIGGTVASVSAASVGKVKNLEAATAPNYVVLSWTKPSGAKGYQVQQYISKKWKTVKTITKSSTTTAKITGLKSKTTYKFRVRAKGSSGYGSYVTISAKTVPGTVKGVTAAPSAKTAVIRWTAVDEVAGYKIEYSTSKSFSKSKTKTKTVKKASSVKGTLSGLTVNKTYYVRVRSYKTLNGTYHYGAYSSTVKFKTTYTGVPSSFKVSSATYNSAVVTWSKVSDASGYHIEKYVNGAWTKVSYAVSKSKTSYTVSGLPSASNVPIRIRPYITISGKDYYGVWKTVTASTGVGPTSGLAYSGLTATSVKLTWKNTASTGAKGYYVKSNGSTIKTVATNSVTLTIKPGTTYKITVVAYNGSKQSAASSAISFTSPCAQVTGVKSTASKETTASFSWTKTTGATGYQVQYRKDGGSWSAAKTTTATAYTFSDLEPNSSYKFRVRAYNKNGSTTQYGAYSAEAAAKTLGISGTVSGDTTTINWAPVSGAAGYALEYYDAATSQWIQIGPATTATTYVMESTVAANYRVTAKDASGNAIFTSENFVLKGSGASVIQDGYSVKLAWNAVSGATGYKVVRSTQAGWEDEDTFGSTTYGVSYFLAPGLTHNFKVYAVLSSGTTELCNVNVLTPNMDLSDISDVSKNAQLHYLAEAVNRSKFDSEHYNVIDIDGSTTHSITYLSFGSPGFLGMDAMLKILFGDSLKGTNYKIDGGLLICPDADSISAFCDFMNDGETNPDNMLLQTENNTVDRRFSKSGAAATGLLIDNETDDYTSIAMEKVIEPTGDDDYVAYIYNGINPSAWKNGFSSVTTTKTENGYKIVAKLKTETTPNYHKGLLSGVCAATSSIAGSEGMDVLTDIKGISTITAEIDEECRLTSYTIDSPYKLGIGVAMSVTGEESGAMNIEMKMNMEGRINYVYTFTRT